MIQLSHQPFSISIKILTAAHTSYVHSEKYIFKFVNSTNNKNRHLSCIIELHVKILSLFPWVFIRHLPPYELIIYNVKYKHNKNTGTVSFFAFYKSSIRLEDCYLFQNIHTKLHYYNAGVYSNCFGDF